MNRSLVLVLSCAAVLTAGCASKKELQEVRAELAACEEKLVHKEAAVLAWEQRFDRESKRWEEMEASVTEALPRALSEFHTERERILELVPEQVESEVAAYLEDYFATVMRGFELLKEDNDEIKIRLEATYEALEAVGADTRSISRTIDETVTEERRRRQDVAQRISGLVARLVRFDQTRVNCKQCEDRLRLNRKERETILGFHAKLMNELAAVQTLAGEPEVPETRPATAEEDETETEAAAGR